MPTNWQVSLTNWSKLNDQALMKTIREKVFIIEQSVPIELEWDGLDEQCIHCLTKTAGGTAIATARMHISGSIGHIGRMAVLKPYRQQGIGTLMLNKLLEHAQKNAVKAIHINAQTTAIAFYERIGFIAVGEQFDDAGIPHYQMTLKIGSVND